MSLLLRCDVMSHLTAMDDAYRKVMGPKLAAEIKSKARSRGR